MEASGGSEVDAGPAIEREMLIDAQPETVFEFFTDPEKMQRWMGHQANLDPRPGGVFRTQINPRAIAAGEFIEVDPPRRLVFTWGWEGDENPVDPGSSTVEVTLSPEGSEGSGGTRLRLVHRDLPDSEREPHTHGWDHYLERLGVAVPGGDAGPDSFADATQHTADR